MRFLNLIDLLKHLEQTPCFLAQTFFPHSLAESTKQESKEKSQDQDAHSSFVTKLTGSFINKHVHK